VTVIVGLILLLVAAIVATTGLLTDVGGTYAQLRRIRRSIHRVGQHSVPLRVVIGAAVLLGLVVLPADSLGATARGRDGRGGGLTLPTSHDVAVRSHGAGRIRAESPARVYFSRKGVRHEGDRCQ
jgi:hypothetical protein